MTPEQCVTKPKIWTKPNPKLFSDTKFFRYRIRNFFRYQIFSIPNPKLFSIPKIFDTEFKTFLIPIFLDAESETDFDNKSEVFSVPIDMKEIARLHEEEEEEDSDDGADAFDSDAEEAESEEYDSDDFTDESTDDEADWEIYLKFTTQKTKQETLSLPAS